MAYPETSPAPQPGPAASPSADPDHPPVFAPAASCPPSTTQSAPASHDAPLSSYPRPSYRTATNSYAQAAPLASIARPYVPLQSPSRNPPSGNKPSRAPIAHRNAWALRSAPP